MVPLPVIPLQVWMDLEENGNKKGISLIPKTLSFSFLGKEWNDLIHCSKIC